MQRKVLIGLLVGILAVSSAFAGGGQQKAAAGRSADAGKLVIYSPNTEDMVTKIIPLFESQTGVKVEIISAGTGELLKRIESEKNSPYADVMWGGGNAVLSAQIDLFEPYVSKYNGDVITQYQNIGGKLTLYCLDGSNLLVNTNLTRGITVESYADLLNPALKGKLIMGDPTSSSSAFAQLTNILLAVGGDYTSAKGWDYVKSLLINLDGKIAQSSSAVHRGAAQGEYAVALTYEDPSVSYVRDGAPVKVVYPKEGAVFLGAATAIVKGAKNLDNAKKFIDFILSPAAQAVYGNELTARPVRSDAVTGTHMVPMKDIKLLVEDGAYVTAHRSEIIERYRTILTSVQ
ncbi:putative periplasmic-iron-binding protein [Spirochaetia bacterium]|nr:putative periplasmic-iron-binding protein [Spirochaetia bacterium]